MNAIATVVTVVPWLHGDCNGRRRAGAFCVAGGQCLFVLARVLGEKKHLVYGSGSV